MSVRTEVFAIEKRHGIVTPDLVVQTARANPKSLLHQQFQWNLKKAAYAHWLDTAREIIRSIKVTIEVEHKNITVSYYVHDPDGKPNEQGYRSIIEIRNNPVSARNLMLEEFRHAEEHLARAKSYALVLGLDQQPKRRAS